MSTDSAFLSPFTISQGLHGVGSGSALWINGAFFSLYFRSPGSESYSTAWCAKEMIKRI